MNRPDQSTIITTNQQRRLKPRKSPNADTWLGRHQAAMDFISEWFDNARHPGRVVAWVIGIGGKEGNENLPTFTPTEHIEVAQALEKAKAGDFCIYAMDIFEHSIAMATAQLRTNTIKAARKGHPKFPKTAQGVDFNVSRAVAEKIVLMGPGDAGDIFLTEPPEKPDVITIFNLARSYHRRHQTQLAKKLADALLPRGILLTNVTESQTAFIRTLEENLGVPEDLGPCPDLGKPGRIVVFTKKVKKTANV